MLSHNRTVCPFLEPEKNQNETLLRQDIEISGIVVTEPGVNNEMGYAVGPEMVRSITAGSIGRTVGKPSVVTWSSCSTWINGGEMKGGYVRKW